MRTYSILFLLLISPFWVLSQVKRSERFQFVYGLGVSSFLGDLGGSSVAGTHVLRDLNLESTRYAVSTGLRFKLSPLTSLRGNLSFARLHGSDQLKDVEFYRAYRNLNFRTSLVEANILFEGSFMQEQTKRTVRMRGIRTRSQGFIVHVNGFAGLGVFYFDPAGEQLDLKGEGTGKWVKLRALHTEGQTLIPSRPKTYSPVQLCIPIGIAFNIRVNKSWNATLEYGIRYTFTDYIDDVSTVYVDPDMLRSKGGELAVKMANKTSNLYPNITKAGAQRGDPRYTDAYMFTMLALNYKAKNSRLNKPKF